uniref:Uncharacterized protein n=1 Tax=Knipowitschia caucasica TaxID=637954 RepID=A0AAV2K5J4_KNICA
MSLTRLVSSLTDSSLSSLLSASPRASRRPQAQHPAGSLERRINHAPPPSGRNSRSSDVLAHRTQPPRRPQLSSGKSSLQPPLDSSQATSSPSL